MALLFLLSFIFLDFLIFGDYSQGVTPLPISNRVVKTLNADGTARAAGWESR